MAIPAPLPDFDQNNLSTKNSKTLAFSRFFKPLLSERAFPPENP
jgi:hypothetical protein